MLMAALDLLDAIMNFVLARHPEYKCSIHGHAGNYNFDNGEYRIDCRECQLKSKDLAKYITDNLEQIQIEALSKVEST